MDKASVIALSEAFLEPKWLQAKRLSAFEASQSLDLPKIERVKFQRWAFDQGSLLGESSSANVPDFTSLDNHPMLVTQDVATVYEQIPQELADKGLVFTDFAQAYEQIPEVIERYFGDALGVEDRLIANHYAKMNSMSVLYVPNNLEVELPIEGIYYQDSDSGLAFNKHVLIIAGKHSKLNYLERFETIGNHSQPTSGLIAVEVIAEAGAQVKFSAIDRLGQNMTAFISRRGLLAEDANIDWNLGVFNDGNVVADFDSDLKGSGSQAYLKAVAISSGKQVQGIDTRVTNYGPHSVGHILQHGVILESGTLTFNGVGHIIRGAKGADAQQESRVLMLSDKARSDANPILLIDENDVTAGHAASIGQVDPEDMYYLMSRGLDQETAERLVIRGFLGTVLTEIPVKSVRDDMIAVIDKKLANR